MKQYLLQLFFLLFAIQVVIAQQFPVQVIPQTIPPRPVVLSDYANASSVNDKVRVQLILNDLTELNREVRLKLFIEGQGINAQSNDVVVGATPIFLEGGVATTLGTAQLAPYFDLQNLQGISPGVYGNSLPEGSYSFCFEVYDLFTGNVVSGKTCTNFVLFDNDPPLLNLPLNAAGIQEMNPLNIVFQWTPRHINVSNVQYELIVSEIWDLNIDPQAAFLSSPPIFQTTTTQTTFIYDGLQPSLIPGKRYGWRVRAFAAAGAEEIGVFTNNGFSEIFYFDYQTQCDEPLFPDVEELTNRSAELTWQGNFDHLDYTVKYREKDAESEWYDLTTPQDYIEIDNLEPETTYEYKIQGNCMFGSYGETFIQEFTTLSDEASSYQGCAIEPEPILLENQERLTELFLYDNFTAGKFKVRVLEVENSTSPFKGKGYVTIPWLGFITIAAEFENIELNTDKELISGAVVTTYDPEWGNIIEADIIINAFVNFFDTISELFNTNEVIDEVYLDGTISDEEIPILTEELENINQAIASLEAGQPLDDESLALLAALQNNGQVVQDVIANASSGNSSLSDTQGAYEAQQAVKDLTRITVFFNESSTELDIPVTIAIPTMSGIPIQIDSYSKIAINDFGGLEWFEKEGVRYLGVYTTSGFLGYYPKPFLNDIANNSSGQVILNSAENIELLKSNEFLGFTIATPGNQAFTLAKRVEGEEATLDCTCQYNWIVENTSTTIKTNVKTHIPPPNAIASNCAGTACNTSIVLGGLGSNLFDAITESNPEIAQDPDKFIELENLKVYLDNLTANKSFALFNTDELKYIGQNSLSVYRTYFKNNVIYNLSKFQEHFPETTFSRDVEIIFSSVNLRENLNEDYNVNSIDYLRGGNYHYAFADLTTRYAVIYIEQITSIVPIIFEMENAKIAQAISTHNGYEQYVAKWGTDDAWMFIAQWSAVYAEDLIEGYSGNMATVKISKIFGQSVKTPSLWKRFVGVFKKSQKMKNRAQDLFANNLKARNVINQMADSKVLQGAYDNTGFKFYLPNSTGDDLLEFAEVAYDGRITIKTENSIANLSDTFDDVTEIKINFPEGSNIRVGSQNYTSGSLEVDNQGLLKFTGNAVDNALNKLLLNSDFNKIYNEFINGTVTRKFADILTIREESIYKFYTNDTYYTFNQSLINGSTADDILELENLLNTTMNKLPSSPGTYFRGIGAPEIDKLSSINVGDNFTYDNFLSTSDDMEIAGRFAAKNLNKTNEAAIVIVKSNNGKNIRIYSDAEFEREILHKSKTSFKMELIEENSALNPYQVAIDGDVPIYGKRFTIIEN
ncbi:fibronectin type III domain-containing protein [Dokdonia sp. Asnod1-B02]|uniref:fibronectin type III domain-containing protein n=1 Tax=Dokdonia sp. Asnod1-B02 TaxID=3160573 RepID=UPI00386A8749